jgi:hypothetical protein
MYVKATLIFPPAMDPRAPQLALPSLAAYLRNLGVDVTLLDLNLTSLAALLQPVYLVEAGRQLCTDISRRPDPHRQRARLADLAGPLGEMVPNALATLRDPQRFFDANAYNTAREVLCAALELISAAQAREVSYGLSPARYDVAGVDHRCLADSIAVTANREANLFADYWENQIFPTLDADRPDVIGISITNGQQILPGLMLARALRERGHFVVIGGTVYTKFAEELASRPAFFDHFADGVVVYEGERAFQVLLEQLQGGRDLYKVPNFLFKDGNRIASTPLHVEDVNALPTPDFAGLPLHAYLAPTPVLPILTGKGCYFNRCKFCDIPYINHISRKAYRIRRPELVVEDVRTLAQRFDCRHFVITDEALSPKRLMQLADAFASYPDEQYAFTGYARLEAGFTPEVCQRLARMGMKKLFFGLESASQRTIDHMDKGTLVSLAPQILRNCRQAGINFHLFSIIGFPEEDEASAWETFQFFVDNRTIIDHPGNTFDIHPFGLELRTAYYEEREQLGVRIKPEALRKDFIIGIAPEDWENARGLGTDDVDRLMDMEFYPALKKVYHRYHNTPAHLWPGFEEYAVLYSDYYKEKLFPYATSLIGLDPRQGFRLSWNPAFVPVVQGDKVVLKGWTIEIQVGRRFYELMAEARYRTLEVFWDEALGQAVTPERREHEALLRAYIERLIGQGLLRLEIRENHNPHAPMKDNQRCSNSSGVR